MTRSLSVHVAANSKERGIAYEDHLKQKRVRRRRWRIRYKGMNFAINVDKVTRPEQESYFAEIKSRTWSKQDALRKASLLSELLKVIGASTDDLILHEYVDLV